MISKTYEWLRIANANPDNVAVENRKKTVAELLGKADQEGSVKLLAELVAASVAGPASISLANAEFVRMVVESIRKFNPAFPSDLSENALDVRATCAITVGESIVRSVKKASATRRTLGSALLVCGSGIRPADGGKFLKAMMSELHVEAVKQIQSRAVSVRLRTAFDTDGFDELTPPNPADVVSFWNLLKPLLTNAFDHIQKQANTDREELNVLWWFYNGQAVGLGKSLGSLPITVAAVAAAIEIGDLVTLPAHQGVAPMIVEAVERGRAKTQLVAKTIAKIVASWNADTWKEVAAYGEKEKIAPESFPVLFPLTWLCSRLTESGSPTGWEQEFESKTGLLSTMHLTPAELAAQVFHERIGRRLLAEEASE